MKKIYRTEWQDFQFSGMHAYRIYKRCVDGVWQQTHEWKRDDGSTYRQEWIRSCEPMPSWYETADVIEPEYA